MFSLILQTLLFGLFVSCFFYKYISRAAVLYQLYNGLFFIFTSQTVYYSLCFTNKGGDNPIGVGLTMVKIDHWDQSALKNDLPYQ